jgi:hypothetical protein
MSGPRAARLWKGWWWSLLWSCAQGNAFKEAPGSGNSTLATVATAPEWPYCFNEDHRTYCLPSLLGACCVGAGTTSLAAYLNAHPQLTFGKKKEHAFFRFRPLRDPNAHSARQLQLPAPPPPPYETQDTVAARLGGAAGSPWALVRVDWSTGGIGDGVAPPLAEPYVEMTQRQGGWRDYAREFPVAQMAATGGAAPRTSLPLGFDFDPTYLGHAMLSRAAVAGIKVRTPHVLEDDLAKRMLQQNESSSITKRLPLVGGVRRRASRPSR